MSSARVYLCAGNTEERFLNIALENLLFEMKTGGQLPLLVYMGNPPFTTGPIKTKQREDTFPYFDYYTGAEIPSVQFSNLLNLLSEKKKRRALMAEEQKFSDIFLYGLSFPVENLYEAADEHILFIRKDASSSGWVYNVTRKLLEKKLKPTIHIIIVGKAHLEEAVVLFFHLREEIQSLLGEEVKLVFDGFMETDLDYTTAAISTGKTVIEFFRGGRFHGLTGYILRNLRRNAAAVEREESFFSRLMSSQPQLEKSR